MNPNTITRRLRLLANVVLLGTAALGASTLWAADAYPSHPIKLLVPLSAGTTTDIVARVVADKLSKRLGQPVIVENKQGAGGVVAAQAMLSAAPDGYTLLLVNSQHVINPAVYKPMPYDTLRDFSGVALVAEAPSLVVVSPQLGVRTMKDFIALAKQKPGSIHYASGGIGSQTHLGGAYLAQQAKIDIVHVPYASSGAVLPDLLSGRVEAVVAPTAFLLGPIKDGKLVPLAVTTKAPMRAPLELSSASDTIPGFEYATWFGIVAASKVPAPIIERLAKELQVVANEPEVKAKFAEQGIVARALPQREFDAYIKTDMDRLAPIASAASLGKDK